MNVNYTFALGHSIILRICYHIIGQNHMLKPFADAVHADCENGYL